MNADIIEGDPTSREWQARLMQSAGPISRPDRVSFFDLHAMEERAVVYEGQADPEQATTFLRALVNHAEPEGFSLQAVRYAPGAYVPRHHHDARIGVAASAFRVAGVEHRVRTAHVHGEVQDALVELGRHEFADRAFRSWRAQRAQLCGADVGEAVHLPPSRTAASAHRGRRRSRAVAATRRAAARSRPRRGSAACRPSAPVRSSGSSSRSATRRRRCQLGASPGCDAAHRRPGPRGFELSLSSS